MAWLAQQSPCHARNAIHLSLPTGSCAAWAETLVIDNRDPTGEKVKRNVDKLISSWMSAHQKRMSSCLSGSRAIKPLTNAAGKVFRCVQEPSIQAGMFPGFALRSERAEIVDVDLLLN